MKYLSKDDLKSLELINNEVQDEELKDKLLKLYISDIRKNEDKIRRHPSFSLDSSNEEQIVKIEYELANNKEDLNEIIIKKLLHEELYKAINQLDETEKLIIQLFFFEEMSTRKIAKALSISQTKVCEIKTKSLKKLKKLKKL